jgi:hypothetical protein
MLCVPATCTKAEASAEIRSVLLAAAAEAAELKLQQDGVDASEPVMIVIQYEPVGEK